MATNNRAFVGCSGWSYLSWRPKFYPAGTKSKDLLAFYGTKFKTIEINYTFRHLPTDRNIADWTSKTPDDFLVGLKASQQITHVSQLREPATTLPIFFERARLLGPRLGPILFQTPKWVRRDDDRLAMFLAALPRDLRCVLEVRDASWYVEDVYELLRTANVALVHAEGESKPWEKKPGSGGKPKWGAGGPGGGRKPGDYKSRQGFKRNSSGGFRG